MEQDINKIDSIVREGWMAWRSEVVNIEVMWIVELEIGTVSLFSRYFDAYSIVEYIE